MPQISLFGINFNIARRFTNAISPGNFGPSWSVIYWLKRYRILRISRRVILIPAFFIRDWD